MSTKKTGWEDLDKWVSPSGGGGGDAAPSGAKVTGWEALDQWVAPDGSSVTVAESGVKVTGWEALDKWVGDDGAPTEPGVAGSAAPSGGSSGGGFMGWLKRLFGGK